MTDVLPVVADPHGPQPDTGKSPRFHEWDVVRFMADRHFRADPYPLSTGCGVMEPSTTRCCPSPW
jgi:hypothetical protein